MNQQNSITPWCSFCNKCTNNIHTVRSCDMVLLRFVLLLFHFLPLVRFLQQCSGHIDKLFDMNHYHQKQVLNSIK